MLVLQGISTHKLPGAYDGPNLKNRRPKLK